MCVSAFPAVADRSITRYTLADFRRIPSPLRAKLPGAIRAATAMPVGPQLSTQLVNLSHRYAQRSLRLALSLTHMLQHLIPASQDTRMAARLYSQRVDTSRHRLA